MYLLQTGNSRRQGAKNEDVAELQKKKLLSETERHREKRWAGQSRPTHI